MNTRSGGMVAQSGGAVADATTRMCQVAGRGGRAERAIGTLQCATCGQWVFCSGQSGCRWCCGLASHSRGCVVARASDMRSAGPLLIVKRAASSVLASWSVMCALERQ
jgi:hypothetical protein